MWECAVKLASKHRSLILLLIVVVASFMVGMRHAAADTLTYPYASKPCIWAPYASSGSGTGWCADYDFGDVPNDATNTNVLSPYGYYYRNCTDYTAWKVSALGVSPEHYKGLGNAKDWVAQAPAHGLAVDSVPAVGSVGVSTTGVYGHTAFVEAVNPDGYPAGIIEVTQFNYAGDGNYSDVFGTAAMFGLSGFIHFEVYETPLAPPPAPAAVPMQTAAAPPADAAPTDPLITTPVAPTELGAPQDPPPAVAEGQDDITPLADTLKQEPSTPDPEETTEPPPEVVDDALATRTSGVPAPDSATTEEAMPRKWWQMATSSPPTQTLTVATPAIAAQAQDQTTTEASLPAVENAAYSQSFASWPLVGLAAAATVEKMMLQESAKNKQH